MASGFGNINDYGSMNGAASAKLRNLKNPCKCEDERMITTTGDPDDPQAKWFCDKCGGYTKKAGVPVYSEYGNVRKVLW